MSAINSQLMRVELLLSKTSHLCLSRRMHLSSESLKQVDEALELVRVRVVKRLERVVARDERGEVGRDLGLVPRPAVPVPRHGGGPRREERGPGRARRGAGHGRGR